jgi:hypothetical protein
MARSSSRNDFVCANSASTCSNQLATDVVIDLQDVKAGGARQRTPRYSSLRGSREPLTAQQRSVLCLGKLDCPVITDGK